MSLDYQILGADLSLVTVGLSFTVAKGFPPLRKEHTLLNSGFVLKTTQYFYFDKFIVIFNVVIHPEYISLT